MTRHEHLKKIQKLKKAKAAQAETIELGAGQFGSWWLGEAYPEQFHLSDSNGQHQALQDKAGLHSIGDRRPSQQCEWIEGMGRCSEGDLKNTVAKHQPRIGRNFYFLWGAPQEISRVAEFGLAERLL